MTIDMIFQRGTPDIINLLLFLLGLLLCLLALNSLFEWLMTKPWKRNKPPEETILENQGEASIDSPLNEEKQSTSDHNDVLHRQLLHASTGG